MSEKGDGAVGASADDEVGSGGWLGGHARINGGKLNSCVFKGYI